MYFSWRSGVYVSVVCTCPEIPTPSQLYLNCGTDPDGESGEAIRPTWHVAAIHRVPARDINTCPMSVAVEAHVPGVAGSGLSNIGLFTASVNRQIPVPYAAPWESKGTHEVTIWLPWPIVITPFPQPLPPTSDVVDIVELREEVDPVYQCEVIEQGNWIGGECQPSQLSAHRRHRPRRLQADERRQGRPVRSERRRCVRAGRMDETRLGRCVSGAGSERQRTRGRWVGAVRQLHAGASGQRRRSRPPTGSRR